MTDGRKTLDLGFAMNEAMHGGFHAEEWKSLSPAEQASRSRLMAEQARLLAVQAEPEHRDAYEGIAREWLRLAGEIEHEANLPSPAAADP